MTPRERARINQHLPSIYHQHSNAGASCRPLRKRLRNGLRNPRLNQTRHAHPQKSPWRHLEQPHASTLPGSRRFIRKAAASCIGRFASSALKSRHRTPQGAREARGGMLLFRSSSCFTPARQPPGHHARRDTDAKRGKARRRLERAEARRLREHAVAQSGDYRLREWRSADGVSTPIVLGDACALARQLSEL